MMNKSKMVFVGTAVAVLMAVTTAYATVTFDSNSGTGFVGKGDVQLAFGWNNATAQKNIPSITFTYESSQVYEGVCVWTTGEGRRGEQTHRLDRTLTNSVIGGVAYNARNHAQIDGIFLTGFGSLTVTGGDAPVVGGACLGIGTDATWESVELVSSTPGTLFVTYNGSKVALQ